MKNKLFNYLESEKDQMIHMSDYIFDNPEYDSEEYKAMEILTEYLINNDFRVEKGIGGLETAFRAVYENGINGPSIGLLCEYDAIKDIGHACGHHMQGPAIVYAAVALKEAYRDRPYKLVVYGTPAEETIGGKIIMMENGCFSDIDVALMFHGDPTTSTDIRSMALSSYKVVFSGKSAHAAMQPEKGRSALDALLLAFNAVEFLREHVKEDTRMQYTVINGGGPDNVVPSEAVGTFTLRSYNRAYLDTIDERFKNILDGAALMTGTTYKTFADRPFDSIIPVLKLNDVMMKNAELVNAPNIRSPREKPGSTDFANIMYNIPGSCIRVAFVPEGTPAHSQQFLDAGKSDEAHNAVLTAAKILAVTCYDLIDDEHLLKDVKEEFISKKAEMSKQLK